ncbi:transcription elongation factor [Hysterangium stoloniferum]|nr:transcription elongation factor [Hysterangium stoloniferum]
MSSVTDVAELKGRIKALQAMSSDKEIQDCLVWLKRNVIATESLLRESKAGLAVGKLRTHSTKAVADLAKELVKKWKGEVDRAKAKAAGGTGNSTSASKHSASAPAVQTENLRRDSTASGRSPSAASPSSSVPVRSARSDNVPTDILGDAIRDKCFQLIYDALASDSGAPIDQITSRARAIEETTYKQHGSQTSQPYRAKMRSLYLNLKDKSNPSLRESVVSGEIPPQKLCNMSSQEMASEERKQADSKMNEANFYNSLGSEEMGAETDAFQCGRCKQRKTRYRQQQTRSADEPMTTFVTCTNCNNRWKFS